VNRNVEAELAELRRQLGLWETELALAGLRYKDAKDDAERARARMEIVQASSRCAQLRMAIRELERSR
jgi:hypothetical protein